MPVQKYDVCLSFASADRAYVRKVAENLRLRNVRIFFDEDEQADLWGKNLQEHFDQIYRFQSRFCVMFISEHYLRSEWTRNERVSAQARAFMERGTEYLLPARFDDAEVPALLPTTAFQDLRETTPEKLAELIVGKLGRAEVDTSAGAAVTWIRPITFRTAFGTDSVPVHQEVVTAHAAPGLDRTVRTAMTALARLCSRDGDQLWWTHQDDRHFDRLLVTAAVATTLLQTGLPAADPMAAGAVRFLRRASPGDLDDRAATIFRILTHDLDEDGELAFLTALEREIASFEDTPHRGSLLLPQGPSAARTAPNWSPQFHSLGAAFHACFLGETLLSVPEGHPRARARAARVIEGFRNHLVRVLDENGGWLRTAQGRRSPQTVYAYSVLPGMGVVLPREWMQNVTGVLADMRDGEENRFGQFLQVMNCWYLYAATRDPAFRVVGADFAEHVISGVGEAEIGRLDGRDLAAFLRALTCAVRLRDERLATVVTQAVCSASADLMRNDGSR